MLRAFEAAGTLGGIRKAAEAIDINHTVVSRHIRALEEWLGVTLVNRVGRGIVLTEEGRAYHARLVASFEELADATAAIVRKRDERSLRIRAVPGFGFLWLSRNLPQYRQRYPGLEIDLRMTDQMSDFLGDDVDLDIRFVPDSDTKTVSRRIRHTAIARPMVFAVASPDYLAGRPAVTALSDLPQHRLIHEDTDQQWRDWFAVHGVVLNDTIPGSTLWHLHVVIEAALLGEGIALAGEAVIADHLRTGRLVRVGPEAAGGYPAEIGEYTLFARAERWDTRPVSRFRNWICSSF